MVLGRAAPAITGEFLTRLADALNNGNPNTARGFVNPTRVVNELELGAAQAFKLLVEFIQLPVE